MWLMISEALISTQCERSKRGLDLLEGMPEYAAMISEALIFNPMPIKA